MVAAILLLFPVALTLGLGIAFLAFLSWSEASWLSLGGCLAGALTLAYVVREIRKALRES